MTRIYTKTGDDGSTGLIGGKRVRKDSARIEAYGAVDELNAALGVAGAAPLPDGIGPILLRVQNDLFNIGASLAAPPEAKAGRDLPSVRDEDTQALERDIDACEAALPPLKQFILPAGSSPGALLHFSRTVARRAERRCVALAQTEAVDPRILRYLNRLSDLLFVLARFVNHQRGRPEIHPTFGKSAGE